jgi:rhodanese-related sulfurtransferase
MAKKKVEEPQEEIADFNEVEPVLDVITSVEDLPEDPKVQEPEMWEEGWQQFVLDQFSSDEKTPEGYPKVHGLRRVVKKLLGPILKSNSRVVQPASFVFRSFDKDNQQLHKLNPSVVEHHLVILMARSEHPSVTDPYEKEITECANCYAGNTEPEFARFPDAMASTRAEARALRKALQLDKPAAEEMTSVPVLAEEFLPGFITDTQIVFIDALCRRNNINARKLINAGKEKYNNVNDVPSSIAAKMAEYLGELQRDQSKIPNALKGYQEGWEK